MKEKHVRYASCSRLVTWFLFFAAILVYGCNQIQKDLTQRSEPGEQGGFVLQEISLGQGKAFLDELGLGTVFLIPHRNALLVTGSPSDLRKARVVLELVDGKDEFVIETLAPAVALGLVDGKGKLVAETLPPPAAVRTVPTNDQIAQVLGDITIGTFADPPQPGRHARGIIDVHGDRVVAIVPGRRLQEICEITKWGPDIARRRRGGLPPTTHTDSSPTQTATAKPQTKVGVTYDTLAVQPGAGKDRPSKPTPAQPPLRPTKEDASNARPSTQVKAEVDADVDAEGVTTEETQAIGKSVSDSGPTVGSRAKPNSKAQRIAAKSSGRIGSPPMVDQVYQIEPPANGDDILELDLPNQIEIIQLLDLVAEYLDLDYVYDPNQIKGRAVTLKLRGKLQGEVRVKDLHPLLESVLKFKGLVMTRHQAGFVTIVPVEDALQVDPTLIDTESMTIEAGDMVITRVFTLQHVDTTSATNMLENMKLSVAVSPIEETRTLFVTCFAHRMGRIERLLNMIDNPGRPKKFRFRRLKYTTADMLAGRLGTLAYELQSVPVTIAPAQETELGPSQVRSVSPASFQPQTSKTSARLQLSDRQSGYLRDMHAVYLDADERTNRILMIGYEQQLVTMEELIDALDVPQQDVRTLRVYDIEHVDASEVKKKLEELEIIGQVPLVTRITRTSPTPPGSAAPASAESGRTSTVEGPLVEEPEVVVLETTNSLLVKAHEEQHVEMKTIIGHVDVAPEDPRTFKVYDIEHVDAEEVKRKLQELEIVGETTEPGNTSQPLPEIEPPPFPDFERSRPTKAKTTDTVERVLAGGTQVVVLEAKNSLLIKATEHQHAEIENIIDYVDVATREQAIPYEIYFLENQTPEELAEVLQKIVQETVIDKEGKIEKTIKRSGEQIVLVPDKATFSIIVYANKKNQEWIASLIKKLDKRRPQVLIDVTLVEISRTDEFDLDLQLATKWPKLQTGGEMDVVGSIVSPFVSGTGEGFSSPRTGTAQGFYSDAHIQALLTAIQSKSYGRVLAKPKILVNDGQPGTIKTVNKTSVKIDSIIIPQEGTQRTTTDFRDYEAGITLTITPNISEGDLLLLQVELDRTDFLPRSGSDIPPDTTTTNVNTVVTVPDGRTIILGGLIKLNQTKGGTKVPLLGDIPLIGGLFRSTSNRDDESRLYVFVKANILRPDEAVAGLRELEKISERNQAEFEKHEAEFQNYQDWPGLKPGITEPEKVLEEP